jgi:hypothetical protein
MVYDRIERYTFGHKCGRFRDIRGLGINAAVSERPVHEA